MNITTLLKGAIGHSRLTRGVGGAITMSGIKDYIDPASPYAKVNPISDEPNSMWLTSGNIKLVGGAKGIKVTTQMWEDTTGAMEPKGIAVTYVVPADSFYIIPPMSANPKTPTKVTVVSENLQPTPVKVTSETNTTSTPTNDAVPLSSFTIFMTKESIPKVPNYVSITLTVVGIIIAAVVIAKKR